jgi:GT2 family glycosyltransferase
MLKVYVVLVNFNGSSDTIECLQSLLSLNYDDFQIIVVDNNSSDNSIKDIIDWSERAQKKLFHLTELAALEPETGDEGIDYGVSPLVLIQARENSGFAAGNNIGIKFAFARNDFGFIWLLNNDAVVNEDSLSALVNSFQTSERIGAVGSKVFFYEDRLRLQSLGSIINENSFFKIPKPVLNLNNKLFDSGQYEDDFEVDDIMGASMLLKKEVINDVGFMPEIYFLFGEETDWNYQIKRRGYVLKTIARSHIFHKKSATIGGDMSKTSLYYRTRNQIILHRKFMPRKKFLLYCVLYVVKKSFLAITLPRGLRKIVLVAVLDGIRGSGFKKSL